MQTHSLNKYMHKRSWNTKSWYEYYMPVRRVLMCVWLPAPHVAFLGDLHCNYGNMHIDVYSDWGESGNMSYLDVKNIF